MKKLIIFGQGEQAEMAYFYFNKYSDYQVATFVVDDHFIDTDRKIGGIHAIGTSELQGSFSPEKYDAFVAIGYNNLNKLRTEKYLYLKNLGYKIASFISQDATNNASEIGENCFILEHNTIQAFVKIGNNVTMWSGNHVGHHSVIEDNCFITSQVVISGGCLIGNSTFIGVNASLRDHIKIGKENMIGPSTLILGNTEDLSVYIEKASEKSKVPSNRLRNI